MHLKSLQLSGFKSFAKKTVFEFSKGITAIVGPNGSGKSNVADGIRWVMGEQSIKTLRGKKSEDVIFSGSDKKARLGMAEVSLELDNSDKKMPIDYSELLISRRIYRSGESDYMINNAKSRLVDVNLLLAKANFGHHTYSVIGQGMIDNFLIATPQERKEFFEEASGVKQYQIKKSHALNKLNNVWQNLATLNIKLQEMEPQLRLLTKQVKKLEKRKGIESELNNLKLEYYSSYWQEVDNTYMEQKEKIDKYAGEQSKIQTSWENLQKQVEHVVNESGLMEKQEKLQEEYRTVFNEKMMLKEGLLQFKMALASHENIAAQNNKSIPQNKLELIKQELDEINELQKKLVGLLDLENNVAAAKKEIVEINKRVDKIIRELEPYIKREIKPKEIRSEEEKKIEKKILNIEKLIREKDLEMDKLQGDIKKLSEEDRQSRSSLLVVQHKYQGEQKNLNEISAKVTQARIELARTETKRYDLRQKIDYEMQGLSKLIHKNLSNLSEERKITMYNRINQLKNQLEIIGGIDPEIDAEYKMTKSRYEFLTIQTEDLKNTIEKLKKLITNLDFTIKKQMKESYDDINKYFQKYFKSLFSGGKAELVLLEEKQLEKENIDEWNETVKESGAFNFFQETSKGMGYAGIEVQATPPGKRLKSINALSGGERALTSIALICAIISSNPSPFVMLDEVDATLDEANSIRFAEILEELSHKIQFIVITHNRATMEKAKLLYGVTMSNDGVSKLVGLNLEEAEKHVDR
ncbi:MAG: AAA family ATPase [Candidatus Kuenenbacteria bacterium]